MQIIRWLFLVVFASVLFNFFAPLILIYILPYLIDKSFDGVAGFIQPVITSAIVCSIFGMTVSILTFMRKVALIAEINIVMLIISIPIFYYSIGEWGAVGAAYALTVVYGLGLVVGLLIIYKNLDEVYVANENSAGK